MQVCLHHILNKWSIFQLACSTEFVPKMHYKSLKYIILLKTIPSPSNDEDELVGCAHSAYPFFGLGLELILILLFNVGIINIVNNNCLFIIALFRTHSSSIVLHL